jgi:multidrug resistance protein MdtO
VELAATVSRQRDTIDRNFDKIRDLADAVLLEFGRDREYDLTARSRIRSWQPLVRIIFMLRLAILRRGLIEDNGVDDPRVAEAIVASSRVLQEIRGMTTVDVFRTPDPPLAARVVPIPHAGTNEPPVIQIAVSLATLSAYLREDVLLDITF